MPTPASTIAYWRRADVPGRRIDGIGIVIFLLVACGWSWFAARWGELRLQGDLPRIDGLVLIGFGPLLGAMVAGSIRKQQTWPVGFRGLDKLWSIAALLVPILVAAAFGIERYHVDPHLDAAVFAASIVVASIGQEIGWREWLYNALAGMPLWASAIVTWLLWQVWHSTFAAILADRFSTIDGPLFFATTLVGSFALAAIVRETRASAFAAGWRAAFALPLPLWQRAIGAVALIAVTCMGLTARRITPSDAYPDNHPPRS